MTSTTTTKPVVSVSTPTTTDLMKCQPYRITFEKLSLGKVIASSKRQLVWKFGFADPKAIEDKKIGCDCRGMEHEIIVTYSLSSGKRQVLMDNNEVYYTECRSINDGKFEYKWTTNNGHEIQMTAYFTIQCHVRKYELLIDGISFYTFPQIFELGTDKAIQRISIQLSLKALQADNAETQHSDITTLQQYQQQHRSSGTIGNGNADEPIYDNTDYTKKSKSSAPPVRCNLNPVLMTEKSERRKVQDVNGVNNNNQSSTKVQQRQLDPIVEVMTNENPPVIMDLLMLEVPTTTTTNDLFDSPHNSSCLVVAKNNTSGYGNGYYNTYNNNTYINNPTGIVSNNNELVSYHNNNTGMVPSTNSYGNNNPFYANTTNVDNNTGYNNRVTDYNQINSIYGSGEDYNNQFQQQPVPPSTIPPQAPNSPKSSMMSPFMMTYQNNMEKTTMTEDFSNPFSFSYNINDTTTQQQQLNEEEKVQDNDVVKMLVNLDDILLTTPEQKRNKGENKSTPMPPAAIGIIGNAATLNDVKAITSSNSSTNKEVMRSHYPTQQQQTLIGQAASQQQQQSNNQYYNGPNSLSPQNAYGNHMMQQQPYHPQYYQQ